MIGFSIFVLKKIAFHLQFEEDTQMWRSVGVDTVECTLSCSERFWKNGKKHSHGFISFAVYNSVSYKSALVMSRSPIRLKPLSWEKIYGPTFMGKNRWTCNCGFRNCDVTYWRMPDGNKGLIIWKMIRWCFCWKTLSWLVLGMGLTDCKPSVMELNIINRPLMLEAYQFMCFKPNKISNKECKSKEV